MDGGVDGIAQFGALNHAIDNDACDGRRRLRRADRGQSAQRRNLLRHRMFEAEALETPTQTLERRDGRGESPPTDFRAKSSAVGQTRRREGRSQRHVVEGTRRQAWRFGSGCRVTRGRDPSTGEKIKLSTEHRAIMMRTAAPGSSILRGLGTSSYAPADGPSRPMSGVVLAVATAVNVTNPTSAIDRTVIPRIRGRILSDVLI